MEVWDVAVGTVVVTSVFVLDISFVTGMDVFDAGSIPFGDSVWLDAEVDC